MAIYKKNVYMDQPMGFLVEGKEQVACKLKKSIYILKKASSRWYLKFNDTIVSFGFKKKSMNRCLYLNINESKAIILIMYVDDILLATNDLSLLHDTKVSLK